MIGYQHVWLWPYQCASVENMNWNPANNAQESSAGDYVGSLGFHCPEGLELQLFYACAADSVGQERIIGEDWVRSSRASRHDPEEKVVHIALLAKRQLPLEYLSDVSHWVCISLPLRLNTKSR